jgi:hypothetical protein
VALLSASLRATRADGARDVKKSIAAANADAYVASLEGWRKAYVEAIRTAVLEAAPVLETVKWGHLVFLSNGPALLVRAEDNRVLFGFWRGRRLRDIEPRLKPGGKYEMATLELVRGTTLERSTVTGLVRAAVALNASLGDPTALPPKTSAA